MFNSATISVIVGGVYCVYAAASLSQKMNTMAAGNNSNDGGGYYNKACDRNHNYDGRMNPNNDAGENHNNNGNMEQHGYNLNTKSKSIAIHIRY